MGKKKPGKAESKAKSKGSVNRSIEDTAAEVIDEVERAADAVLREIRDSFDFLGDKVTDTAKYAAKTTKAVKNKVVRKQTARHIQGLMKEVQDAGDNLLSVIGSSFDSLRDIVLSSSAGSAGDEETVPVSKPRASAKKAATGKITTAKKAPAKKKTVKRKTAVRKAAPVRKKAASRKTAPARKKAAVRKTAPVRKKTTARKATAPKQAPVRKKKAVRR